MNKLGKLEKVNLRDIWPNEEYDFSVWLSKEENLKELSNTIGIDIVLEERESAVGKYSVDIYGKEEGTERKVVIENQLEDSNHDHLGKIITYASGKDAKTIIWIVKRARDEHRQAIEWLNSHTDEEVGFFLLEIESEIKLLNSKVENTAKTIPVHKNTFFYSFINESSESITFII